MLRSLALNENHFPCCRLAHFDFYFDFFFWQHFPPTTTHNFSMPRLMLCMPLYVCVCILCFLFVSYLPLVRNLLPLSSAFHLRLAEACVTFLAKSSKSFLYAHCLYHRIVDLR